MTRMMHVLTQVEEGNWGAGGGSHNDSKPDAHGEKQSFPEKDSAQASSSRGSHQMEILEEIHAEMFRRGHNLSQPGRTRMQDVSLQHAAEAIFGDRREEEWLKMPLMEGEDMLPRDGERRRKQGWGEKEGMGMKAEGGGGGRCAACGVNQEEVARSAPLSPTRLLCGARREEELLGVWSYASATRCPVLTKGMLLPGEGYAVSGYGRECTTARGRSLRARYSFLRARYAMSGSCLLYTSDAADDM
eukprot:3237447-Rhodomonas_salina.1